jgi:phosphoglycolate phosphatase
MLGMARRPTTVIFDLDGVLVDSRAAISGSMNHALAAHGAPTREPADLYQFIGPPLAEAFAALLAAPTDSPAVRATMTAYRERYAVASLTDSALYPGIEAALDALGDTHRLAVATSKPLPFTEPLLAALGLRDRFEVVAGPDLDARQEPKAVTIATALAKLGPTRAVMVGDRSFDMLGAQAHGLPAIGALWGFGTSQELTASGADTLVATPPALAPAVAELLLAYSGR